MPALGLVPREAAPIEHPVASVDEPIEAVERPLATVEEPITEEALAPFPPAAHDQVPAFETVPDEPLADLAASEPIVEDIVEALRRDVERLDTAPAASTRQARPVKKLPPARRPGKGKPVQDEWGFFDPEQCGFAALLAKLEEVTRSDDPLKRKRA